MSGQSARRAHARNCVAAAGDELIAIRGAIEIHELFPEHAALPSGVADRNSGEGKGRAALGHDTASDMAHDGAAAGGSGNPSPNSVQSAITGDRSDG
jgi:hypothetical protein